MLERIQEIKNQYKLQMEKMQFRIKELESQLLSRDKLIKELGEKIGKQD
jgi:uncharacterized coiled-coil protein SlyX